MKHKKNGTKESLSPIKRVNNVQLFLADYRVCSQFECVCVCVARARMCVCFSDLLLSFSSQGLISLTWQITRKLERLSTSEMRSGEAFR